jgi:glycosyltransferase involved in cell wall biosynthesis
MNNKILMLINEFPPIAESGVQRPLKFLKYLVRDGWETFVITPRKKVKSITDESLIKEIPPEARIFRTASWGINSVSEQRISEARSDYGNSQSPVKRIAWILFKGVNDLIMPLDKQIGWVPFAFVRSVQLIRKYHIRNVYITAFPFSAFITGVLLKIWFKDRIFWVADYRDAWQFAPLLKESVHSYRYRFICSVDELVLRKADHVIFTSPYVRQRYEEKYPWLQGKADVITNGYDEDDFMDLPKTAFDKFTFVYMGKIHPALGNPLTLLQAIREILPGDKDYLNLGTIGQNVLTLIREQGFDFFNHLGYRPHAEALAYSAGADINVIIVNSDAESRGVFPGKVFELIRIGRPILAIGPKAGVVRELLEQTKAGVYASIEDKEEIKRALQLIISGVVQPIAISDEIKQYSRQELTKRLITIYLSK